MTMTTATLDGQAILVVEDEYFVARDLARSLQQYGATVIGPAASVEMAIELIVTSPEIDGAVLDVNLGGEMAFPAADLLTNQSIPLIFTTGYDQSVIPTRFERVTRCEKPVDAGQVCRTLAAALRRN